MCRLGDPSSIALTLTYEPFIDQIGYFTFWIF